MPPFYTAYPGLPREVPEAGQGFPEVRKGEGFTPAARGLCGDVYRLG